MQISKTLWATAYFLIAGTVLAEEPLPASATSKIVSTSDPLEAATDWDLNGPLNAARVSFLQVDMRAAAAKIREASHSLRNESRVAAADVKQSLVESANKLESLAQRVETRNVERVEELDQSFSQALHAAAQRHYLQGVKHWRSGEPKLAGHRLKAAADYLESASVATGHRLGAATEQTIRESRLLSSKLIHGAGYTTDEVGRAFRSLGAEVESVGGKVAPVASGQPASLQSR